MRATSSTITISFRRAWAAYAVIAAILISARFGIIRLPVIDHGAPALLISSPDQWPYLFPFFFAGSALYIYRSLIPKWAPIFAGAVLILLATTVWGGMYWALALGGTYAIIYAALSSSVEVRIFSRRVDLSYGTYLYGWPVAQSLLYFSHQKVPPLALFLTTMVGTLLIAYASWHFVEAPVLRRVRSGGP